MLHHRLCAWHEGQGHREVKGHPFDSSHFVVISSNLIRTWYIFQLECCCAILSGRGEHVVLLWRVSTAQKTHTQIYNVCTYCCYGNHISPYDAHAGKLLFFGFFWRFHRRFWVGALCWEVLLVKWNNIVNVLMHLTLWPWRGNFQGHREYI